MEGEERIGRLEEELCSAHLPRWKELPDFGLYLDQVLLLVDRSVSDARQGGGPGADERVLTASMVGNYVKMGAVPAPERKKYYRRHLALLIVISILKPVIAIGDIRDFLSADLTAADGGDLYDAFCGLFEQAGASAAAETKEALDSSGSSRGALRTAFLLSALRACAARSVANILIDGLKNAKAEEAPAPADG